MMASQRYVYLLVVYCYCLGVFATKSTFSEHSRGRKLFGGYRIEPKVCRPSNPSRVRGEDPPICMFNYECSQRNGQVVGACMDGFLFGACCQLPASSSSSLLSSATFPPIDHETKTFETTKKATSTVPFDHQSTMDDLSQPDILENPDNSLQNKQEPSELKPVATLTRPDQVLQIDPVYHLPSLFSHGLPASNTSHLETVLLDQNGTTIDNKIDFSFMPRPTNRSTVSPYSSSPAVATTKKLGSSTESTRLRPTHYMNTHLISSSTESNLVRVNTLSGNKKHDDSNDFHKEEIAINHIISILNASTPSGSSASSSHVTQQLNTGSSSIHGWVTIDDTSESTNTQTFPYTYYKPVQSTKPANFYHYQVASSTPLVSTTKSKPTRPSNIILSSDFTHKNNYNYPTTQSLSSSYQYLSTKPTTLPPAPTVIVLGPLGTNDFTSVTSPKPFTKRPINNNNNQQQNKPIYSSSSSSSSYYSSPKPSSLKPFNKSTIKPNQTKKPGTTITHNISTIISTDTSADTLSSSNIISTSFINVKLKDSTSPKPSGASGATSTSSSTITTAVVTKKPTVWTTLSAWSSKPSFQLRPGQTDLEWAHEGLTPVHTIVFKPTSKPVSNIVTVESDEVEGATTTNDHLINFPPDRNPNLTNSTPTSQQEKPTIVEASNNTNQEVEIENENEIHTPSFIEDEVLTNKVDDFVNKIVDSLQGNFQDLKDIVYSKKNATTPTVVTKKPPTKRPTQQKVTTKKPPTKRPAKPATYAATTGKPVKVTKPDKVTTATVSSTKRPIVTTKRPVKPTKKVNITSSSVSTTQKVEFQQTTEAYSVSETTLFSTTPDFRRECGVRPMIKTGRVVGGRNATFGEWPWQVLVREATWLGLFTKNKCGGVLITEKYVITAAHCQPGFLASLVAVFGEYDISGELEQRRSVSRNVRRVIVHREYDAASFANDLAILELEKPVEFDAHIVPICMPDDNTDYVGRMATVTGWGRVKYNGGVPSILQEVQVPIMENSVCQEMFRTAGHSKLILDSFLCAGYANGQKDSCEGDSGGPLMMEKPDGRWFLVGTVSHGIKCAAPYLPGVYMRTAYFKPWLHSVTGV